MFLDFCGTFLVGFGDVARRLRDVCRRRLRDVVRRVPGCLSHAVCSCLSGTKDLSLAISGTRPTCQPDEPRGHSLCISGARCCCRRRRRCLCVCWEDCGRKKQEEVEEFGLLLLLRAKLSLLAARTKINNKTHELEEILLSGCTLLDSSFSRLLARSLFFFFTGLAPCWFVLSLTLLLLLFAHLCLKILVQGFCWRKPEVGWRSCSFG